MFAYLEKYLRNQGDGRIADAVGAIHALYGRDVPIEETQLSNVRFSPEQQQLFEKKGHKIFNLTGRHIEQLREEIDVTNPRWTFDKFLWVPSKNVQVAVCPSMHFLRESQIFNETEQKNLINEFTQEVIGFIPGVTAIIGTAADYVDLAQQYRNIMGERFFNGDKKNPLYNATYTADWPYDADGNIFNIAVGYTGDRQDPGLHLSPTYNNSRDLFEHIGLAPLIVPVSFLQK